MPWHGHRIAGLQNNYGIGIGAGNGVNQRILTKRQGQIWTIEPFSLVARCEQDDYIRLLSEYGGFHRESA
ncbi:hypothetical protein D3C84_900260 [compost metagenome]